jgi:hypothetical protein
MRVNVRLIGNAAKKVGELLLYASPMIFTGMLGKGERNTVTITTYDDVIGCIMRSSLLSSDKCEIISLVERDSDIRVYRAIIHVMNSSMLGSDKVKAIKQLCGK